MTLRLDQIVGRAQPPSIGVIAEPAKQQPAVPHALDTQRHLLDLLSDRLTELNIRLASVLGPEQPANAPEKHAGTGCELAAVITDHNQRIDAMITGVRYLLDRLEL